MFEVGSRKRLSGAWCAQGKKNAGIYGEKNLACVKACTRAAGDHLVEITSASGVLVKGARA